MRDSLTDRGQHSHPGEPADRPETISLCQRVTLYVCAIRPVTNNGTGSGANGSGSLSGRRHTRHKDAVDCPLKGSHVFEAALTLEMPCSGALSEVPTRHSWPSRGRTPEHAHASHRDRELLKTMTIIELS
jgi:hypothetical protein